MADFDTDRLLLTRFARGERDALAALAARHEPALLGLASGLLAGRPDLAQDAVQDVWLRVVKYAPSFNGHSTVKTWLYRILINRCKDLRSAESRRATAVIDASVEPAAETIVPPAAPDPELTTALDALPAPTRLLLLLCYHRGLTHEQAAEILGIPVGTLKSRLHAALETLRAALKPGAAS